MGWLSVSWLPSATHSTVYIATRKKNESHTTPGAASMRQIQRDSTQPALNVAQAFCQSLAPSTLSASSSCLFANWSGRRTAPEMLFGIRPFLTRDSASIVFCGGGEPLNCTKLWYGFFVLCLKFT